MKLAMDVGYFENGATAAGVVFDQWHDAKASREICIHVASVQPYEPGQFYKRELPCLMAVIEQLTSDEPLDCVVVDGLTWLSAGDESRPGLGAYLYEELARKTPVIGVAKTWFNQCGARELYRGESKRPLFVSAAGVDEDEAVQWISSMHGNHRIPALLKQVDRLSRIQVAT